MTTGARAARRSDVAHVLARLAASFADAVWPARCALCAAEDLGDGLGCAEHRFETGLPGPRCGRCAAALASMLQDGERCPDCRARAPGFARVVALASYRASANAEWLLALKYGGRADLAEPLGQLLAVRLEMEREFDAVRGAAAARPVLVPVPLHLARRIERGYDQAWLLAHACSQASGVPVSRALRRVRATSVQGAVDTTSRAANVRGAFAPSLRARWRRGALVGADAWLVDDVLTSGSTAAECARVLRRLGAQSVSVLCVARP